MLNQRMWLIAAGLAILSGCQPAASPPTIMPAKPAPAPVQSAIEPAPSASEPQAIIPELPAVEEPIIEEPPPLAEVPAEVRAKLEALGARIIARPYGYAIDIRRKPDFTDNEIDLVIQCPQVIDLTLEGVAITDRGLAKLEALQQLTRLILNDCPIGSSGLETLAKLPLRETMISIGLRATQVQDNDLESIKGFTRLERLDVSQTALTDASLPALQSLPLKYLNVAGTQISAAGIEQLRQTKPKLVVKQ